jgi:hypothetical protein
MLPTSKSETQSASKRKSSQQKIISFAEEEGEKENSPKDFNLYIQILYKHIVLIFLCCFSLQPKL